MSSTVINGPDVSVPGTATLAAANISTLLLPQVSKAVDYGAAITDEVILVTVTGKTVTLPDATTCAGKRFVVKLTASGSATVATTSAQNIDAATTYSLSAQYKFVAVVSDGSQWWITSAN